jgi:endonuclease/exonuclease/phosphatase (EEP) superfamily protein YafD
LSRLGGVAVGLALGGVMAPGASRVLGEGALAWAADLAAHWVWLWLPLGAIGLLCVRWKWRARIVAAAALLLVPWWWLPPPMPAGASPAQLRVVVANVHLGNRDPLPLLTWARQSQADVIAVLELAPAFAQALPATPEWPHRHLMPSTGSFGIGVLSRWPLRAVREVEGPGGIAQLRAVVATSAGEFELIAVHPMPPINPHWHALRNRTLAELKPAGAAPALIVGDFNATPWSNAAPLLAANGWRWFGGVQPTWPHAAWGIPIDAVWGHGAWQVVDRAVGPAIGSDHRPLRVEVRLATSAAP